MFERIIYDRIKDRLDWYAAEALRFEVFLLARGIGADEAHRAREAFADTAPTLVMGYARQGTQFPCVALVLGTDSNVDDYLGEDAPMLGTDDDDDEGLDYYRDEDGQIVDPHMRRWEGRADLFVYSDHPDMTLYLYHIVKDICVRSRKVWHSAAFEDVRYSGAELAPDPKYLPTDMFTRRFSITLRYHEYYTDDPNGFAGTYGAVSAAVADAEPLSPALTEAEAAGIESYSAAVTPYQPTTEEEE